MPVLIDVGPSKRGWSYYAPAFRCLHLAGQVRLGLDDETEPHTRGALGHVAQAHHYARWMLRQRGEDPATYYPPEDAMEAHCATRGDGWAELPRMVETFRRYVGRYPDPPGRVLAVEHEVAGVLGTLDGAWGLWSVRAADVDAPAPAHFPSGRAIQSSCLDCPGHPEDGQNLYVTRKLDLVFGDTSNRVYVRDHKHKGSDVGKAAAKRLAMSGEFAVTRILASQVWPAFFAADLNLIQTCAPWRVCQPEVPLSPWRDKQFARDLFWKAHELARLERDVPLAEWPMANHESVCCGRYDPGGLCPAMLGCMDGPRAPVERP